MQKGMASPSPEDTGSVFSRGANDLFGGNYFRGLDGDIDSAVALGVEFDCALFDGEDRVVGAHADARARVPLRAALAAQDVAGNDVLAAVALDAKAFAFGVAAVSRRAACFFCAIVQNPRE